MKEKFIPPFRRFVLQNFPFIEHDFDALTSYELWSKVVEYLNKVINSQNELTEEMQQYVDYINHYFDNLDVQEEINNKLDEMAESGELADIVAQYIELKGLLVYNTVAEMKSAENLVNGSIAKTLGYNNYADGGGSTYKIVDNDSLVADDGSIIDLDNGLKAVLVVDNTIKIAQFGIDGDHNSNIDNFITYVNSNNLIDEIEFESGVSYNLDLRMTFDKANLKINGHGATIIVSSDIKRDDIFRIVASNSCIVENLTINGDLMPQDQWSEQVIYNISSRTCFRITSPNIIVNNTRITNVWGEGLQLYGYESVDIHDCIFDKIGGDFWYHDAQTGAYDNFGDAVYLSGHSKDATISINNCVFNGYENSDATKNDSRCGIVFENLSTYDMTGIRTNVSVNNTIIKNFSRPLHHEAYTSLTHMVFSNCDLIKGSCLIASRIEYTDLIIDNCRITYHDKINYMGSAGISGFNAVVRNSNIRMADDYSSYLSHNSNITYRNCTIDNVNGILNLNGYSCVLEDCIINFDNDYNGQYLGGSSRSNTVFNKCTFNKETLFASVDVTSGSVSDVYECIFNNIFPVFRPHFKDLKTIFNFSSAPSTFIKRYFSKTTVYINNVLTSRPNINEVLPANEYCFSLQNTDDGRTGSGNGTYINFNGESLPIIPATLPFNITLKKNSKYIMVMFASNEWTNLYTNNLSNVYYTDLTFNASGVASIGEINTKGTIPSANELTFSGSNVSGTGSSTNLYMVWILPYEYKQMLGLE